MNFHKIAKAVAMAKLPLLSGFVILYTYALDRTLVHEATLIHNHHDFFLRPPEPDIGRVVQYCSNANTMLIVSAWELHKGSEPYGLQLHWLSRITAQKNHVANTPR